jgi:hypothetical protein
MWLAQFVCAPQFLKTPSGLCGHTVLRVTFCQEVHASGNHVDSLPARVQSQIEVLVAIRLEMNLRLRFLLLSAWK